MPVFIVLLNREAPLSAGTVGNAADVEAPRRNAVGAIGLEASLRSLSASLTGDGESSMISTQPDVSAPGVLFGLVSRSALLLVTVGLTSAALARNELERIVVTGLVVRGE